jgi:glycosyl transferase family 87
MRKQVAAAVALFGLSLIFIWRGAPDGDVIEFGRYGHAVLDGQLPYRDFHLEYPPGAIPLFTLPALGEYVTWFRLENALAWVAVIVLTGALLDTLRPRDRLNPLLLAAVALVPLLLGPFTLMRFDGWPTALVLAALLCLLRGRPTPGLGLLAVGAVVKAWPLALLPLFVAYGVPRRALVVCGAVLVLALAPFAVLTPGGAYNGLMAQPNRHLEYETIGASTLFALGRPVRLYFETGSFSVAGSGANTIATLHSVVQLAMILLIVVVFVRSRRGPQQLVTAVAATVAVAAVLGKVLSPQFLLWMAPFVALADEAALVFFLGACACTRGLFLGSFRALSELHRGMVALLAVRNVLLLATTGALLRAAWRR